MFLTRIFHALCLVIIALSSGCSADQAKRTAYETLQNIRQRDCLEDMSPDCGKRESYENYERKRKELDPSE